MPRQTTRKRELDRTPITRRDWEKTREHDAGIVGRSPALTDVYLREGLARARLNPALAKGNIETDRLMEKVREGTINAGEKSALVGLLGVRAGHMKRVLKTFQELRRKEIAFKHRLAAEVGTQKDAQPQQKQESAKRAAELRKKLREVTTALARIIHTESITNYTLELRNMKKRIKWIEENTKQAVTERKEGD
ncbi:MAG TPA: hypothetical protein VJA40_04215 [archaeon]|nr:hypothetical protein [archaeon]